jgi:hypothetical protein
MSHMRAILRAGAAIVLAAGLGAVHVPGTAAVAALPGQADGFATGTTGRVGGRPSP